MSREVKERTIRDENEITKIKAQIRRERLDSCRADRAMG